MLTSETVAKIKSYLADGHRIGEIAATYQISRQAVSKIASGGLMRVCGQPAAFPR